MTTSLIIGSVPAVFLGSLLSSRAPDRYVRPAITLVIFASGLKYVGVGTSVLGWVLATVLLGGAALWLAYLRPWRSGAVQRRRRPALDGGGPEGTATGADSMERAMEERVMEAVPDRRPSSDVAASHPSPAGHRPAGGSY